MFEYMEIHAQGHDDDVPVALALNHVPHHDTLPYSSSNMPLCHKHTRPTFKASEGGGGAVGCVRFHFLLGAFVMFVMFFFVFTMCGSTPFFLSFFLTCQTVGE